jgi:hypothetical protein
MGTLLSSRKQEEDGTESKTELSVASSNTHGE